ncbi:MAG: DUF3089 domain-containing protein [Myxococcota bacterium]|jgi:hypothetical protein
MNRKSGLGLVGAFLAVFALAACGGSEGAHDGGTQPDAGTQPTDYSVSAHWLALPIAPVPSYPVDVFYLYPTAWTSTDNTTLQYCQIDDPTLLAKAPVSFAKTATVFETVANIYAPFYRQANLVVLALPPAEHSAAIAGIPTIDATAAFDYYIKNYNHGRPFFLLGHSQGSDVLTHLLSGYMAQHPEVLKNMIAAYIIGNPVTAQYMAANPQLKYAQGASDTGVIISWNTQSPNVTPGTNPVLMNEVGIVMNPITWTRDGTEATTAQGLGSILPQPIPNGTWVQVPQYADAKVDQTNGVLICSSCDETQMALIEKGLPQGIYHDLDIPFYYFNIRANAANRAQKFLNAGK